MLAQPEPQQRIDWRMPQRSNQIDRRCGTFKDNKA